jgi:hypothetical protein
MNGLVDNVSKQSSPPFKVRHQRLLAQTAYNSSNNGARSFDIAQLNLKKEIVVFAPLLLPPRCGKRIGGLRLTPQKNCLLKVAFAASFLSGKSNGVVAANVRRKFCG